MIQRPQTLFLLGSILLMVFAVRLPSWSVELADAQKVVVNGYLLKAFEGEELTKTSQVIYPAIVGALSVLISLISIFKFKNRNMQMKLGMLNSIAILAYVGLISFMSIPAGQALIGTEEYGSYQVGFYLPLLAVFLNTLANRFIKKDEDLVRSVDRIR